MSDQAEWQSFNGKTVKDTIIKFYDKEVQNPKKSLTEGKPVFDSKIYILKLTPGDQLLKVDRPMRDEDKMEFPDQWQAYEQKKDQKIEGLPIEEWPQLSTSQCAQLKALEIHTVEHIANLSDGVAHKIMNFQGMRKKAQEFLQGNSEKDNLIKQQQEAIEKLSARLDELEKPKKKVTRKNAADTA